MLASRPASSSSSSEARAQSAEATGSRQEENGATGIHRDALREETSPLFDLDDVDVFESELAACFDAPPPPPLSIRQEEATASVWSAPSEPRYVENRNVVLPAAAAKSSSESTAAARNGEQQQQLQAQVARASSDFSNLYSLSPQRAMSSGQLYPALAPSAPPTEATINTGLELARTEEGSSALVAQGAAAAQRGNTGVAERGGAVAGSTAAGGATDVAAGATATAMARVRAGNSREEVVEELLSENERLRKIIEEMSEQLEMAFLQIKHGGDTAVLPLEPAEGASRAAQTRTLAVRPPQDSLVERKPWLACYPGARAEAARRQREAAQQAQQQQQQQAQQQQQQQEAQQQQQEAQQQQQQQEAQQQQQQQEAQQQTQTQTLRRGIYVHFKCDNCPQWLKVPGHAQLVFCPTCSHTSQMSPGSTVHFPPNNEMPPSSASAGASAGAGGINSDASGATQEEGWFEYIKSILAS